MKEDKLGQEPAFATSAALSANEDLYQSGMSKRFYAACAAMQGFIAMGSTNPNDIRKPDYKNIIIESYAFADELLKRENL